MFGTWLVMGLLIVALIYLSMIVRRLYKDVDNLRKKIIDRYSLDGLIDNRLEYYKLIIRDRIGWAESALNYYATNKELDILIADLGYERLGVPARPEQMSFVKKSRIN